MHNIIISSRGKKHEVIAYNDSLQRFLASSTDKIQTTKSGP